MGWLAAPPPSQLSPPATAVSPGAGNNREEYTLLILRCQTIICKKTRFSKKNRVTENRAMRSTSDGRIGLLENLGGFSKSRHLVLPQLELQITFHAVPPDDIRQ